MATVEAFIEYGKLFGKIQKLRPPMFVMLFKGNDGNLFPVFEGNNEVEPGTYEIYLFQPYKTNGEKMERAGFTTIRDNSELEIIVVWFNTGMLQATSYCSHLSDSEKLERWNKEAETKGDRLQRYIGWRSDQANRMING